MNEQTGEPLRFIAQINFSEVSWVEKLGADKNRNLTCVCRVKTGSAAVVKFG